MSFPSTSRATGCYIHSALHEAPFATLAHDVLYVELRYHAEAGECLGIPHAFTLRALYTLSPDGLCPQAVIRHESDYTMPFALG